MSKYADNPGVLIADIDCTAAGKPLCDAHGVKGYPTIKYGDPNALEDYKGGRSMKDLEKFASELGPSCGPGNLDICSDEEKAEIEELMKMSDEDLEEKISAGTKKMEEAEATFKSEVEKLQEQYQNLQTAKEEALAEVQESGLGNLKKIRAFRASEKKKDDGEDKDEL